jgi:hypothetical protein
MALVVFNRVSRARAATARDLSWRAGGRAPLFPALSRTGRSNQRNDGPIGRSFDAFSNFPSSDPTKSDKEPLLLGVGLAALEPVGLAVSALALSITSCLWIWTSENNVMAVRRRVYMAVTTKDMARFDTKMGSEGNDPSTKTAQGPVGAGGEIRKVSVISSGSTVFGHLLQRDRRHCYPTKLPM